MPFQSYLVGVSDSSFDFVASQPFVLSALYLSSFHEIKYLTSPSSVIEGYVIGACQSSLESNDHEA